MRSFAQNSKSIALDDGIDWIEPKQNKNDQKEDRSVGWSRSLGSLYFNPFEEKKVMNVSLPMKCDARNDPMARY